MSIRSSSADTSASGCVVRFEPRSKAQRLAQRLYQDPATSVLILLGPAGCGKTHLAVGLAASDVANSRTTKRAKVVVLRPSAEADGTMGYLPGTLDEKLQPYTTPITHALKKVAFGFPAGCLSFEALAYARGVTYDDTVVLSDEAQNLTARQIKLVLTRLGRNSKLVFTADPDQTDVRPTVPGYDADILAVADALEGLAGVAEVEFPDTDSLRHPLIAPMLQRLRAEGL